MKELFETEGKKGQLLLASLALFSSEGFDRVSVRDIAKRAGVSEAALYKHFSGKEEMALYIFRKIINEYTFQVSRIAREPVSAVERLCRIQKYTYSLYRDDPESVGFVLLSQYQFWDRLDDAEKPHFWLRMLLEEGIVRREIAPKPVYLWISLYSGLIFEPLIQYRYFFDEMPSWEIFSEEVSESIRSLFGSSGRLLSGSNFFESGHRPYSDEFSAGENSGRESLSFGRVMNDKEKAGGEE